MKYKKIADFGQYNKYCNRHEELVMEDPDIYIDEIELLAILIDEFDRRENEFKSDLNPVEILNSILDEENITNAELAKEIGTSRQLISENRRYRRNISKDIVMKLSDRFKMRPEAFSRPYTQHA